MASNPAAQTAFGPMVQTAIEQYEPPARRLVFDDLARSILPARQRLVVDAMRWRPLRRLTVWAGEKAVPSAWSIIVCRKRFIDDALDRAVGSVDSVVVLGAGLDTRALRLARRSDVPVFEVDQPVNTARKASAIRRSLGALPASVRLVPVDFERDDLIGALRDNGFRAEGRVFVIWEGVTQYLTEDAVRATLTALQPLGAGSRLVFTFVRQDFLDGTAMYGADILYNRFRRRRQVWRFGLQPEDVASFVADYGWRLAQQAGPEFYVRHYLKPSGRDLAASDLEWTAYAEKV